MRADGAIVQPGAVRFPTVWGARALAQDAVEMARRYVEACGEESVMARDWYRIAMALYAADASTNETLASAR